MEITLIQVVFYYITVVVSCNEVTSIEENNTASNETNGYKDNRAGVDQGMINHEKYVDESIPQDEQRYNDIYKEYVSLNEEPINYEDWLIKNKFEILENMQELEKERSGRKLANEINKLIHDVERGEILVTKDRDRCETSASARRKYYELGVRRGLIDYEKYPFSAFVIDEPKFKRLYWEYVRLSDKPIKYRRWLIRNNFGILQDTQLSIMQRALDELKRPSNRNKFIKVVRRGDILLTNGDNNRGSIGFAAIMVTDNFVLEMPGHKKNKTKMLYRSISNNRRIMKQIWFDQYRQYWIHVYRYPDSAVGDAAARWAYRNYYNPTGGSVKTIHVTYEITLNLLSKNPSYCSKLVLQAYYFGTNATVRQKLCKYQIVFPTELYKFFRKSLKNMGRY